MTFVFICVFILFFGAIEMKTFCDSFEENDFRISYGFKNVFQNFSRNYIFIDKTYWELTLDYSYENRSVLSLSSDGNQSNWFGNQYSMAFTIYRNKSEAYETILVDKSLENWEIGVLVPDSLDLNGIANKSKLRINESLLRDKIAFVPISINRSLVVVYGTDHRMEFIQSTEPFVVEQSDKYKALNETLLDLEVVAIYDNIESNDTLIVLFKANKSLKYCLTSGLTLNPECSKDNLSLLVECKTKIGDNTIWTTVTTTVVTTLGTPDDSIVFIIAIIFIFIIFIIVIIVIIMYAIKRRNEVKPPKRKKPKKAPPKDVDSEDDDDEEEDEEEKQVSDDKVKKVESESFSVESNVDYSKPIPLKAKSTDSMTQQRPTELRKAK